MILNILHFADVQIELRTSGEGSQRFSEYAYALNQIRNEVKQRNPDMVIIAGDVFEFADTNGEEELMFTDLLIDLKQMDVFTLIFDGNHDIKQKNNGIVKDDGLTHLISSPIKTIVRAINSENIVYLEKTGLYEFPKFDVTFALSSQINKHSPLNPKPPYLVWDAYDIREVNTNGLIELFHDPIRNCKDFNGEPKMVFTDYRITLDVFKSNLVIAGDIHNPDIIRFGENNDRIFTYSSSLVQRNYGEGNYYSDGNLIVNGNDKHGFNTITFNTETNKVEQIKFISVKNPISRHTINLSKEFVYEQNEITTVAHGLDTTAYNKVRLIACSNPKQFALSEQMFIDTFNEIVGSEKLEINFGWTSDVLVDDFESIESFDDFESALDKNEIKKVARNYIENLVNKTTIVDKDDKPETIENVYRIFENEFSKIEFDENRYVIDIIGGEIDNFMNFGKTSFNIINNKMTRVLGSNGVGKTKLESFIAWILTDKISHSQVDKYKKLNYLLYFNDTNDIDEVNGTLDFKVNSVLHKLKKKLTREWKKDKKDIKNPNKFDFIKDTPIVTYELTIYEQSGEKVLTEHDEVREYLNNIVNFDSFMDSTFEDSYTLHNLVHTKTEDLIQTILNSMGLGVISNMELTFDRVKSEHLDHLVKPIGDKKQLSEEIKANNEIIEVKKESILVDEAELLNLMDSKKVVTSKLEAELATLYKVPKISDIENEIVQIQSNIELKKSSIESQTEKLEKAKEIILDEFDTDLKIDESKTKIDTINTSIDEKRESVQQKTKIITDLKEQIRDGVDLIKEKLADETRHIRDEVAELETKKNKIDNDVKDVINKFNSELYSSQNELMEKREVETTIYNEKVSEYNSSKIDISKLESLYNNSKDKVDELSKQKIDLENSTECSQCGESLSGERLENHKKHINDVVSKIESENKIINETFEKIEKSINDLNAKRESIQTIKDSLNQFKVHISGVSMAIERNSIHDNDYVNYSPFMCEVNELENEKVKLIIKIDELKQEISDEKLKESLLKLVKSDAELINKNREVTKLKNEITEIESEIESTKAILSDEKNTLLGLENYKKIIDANKNDIMKIQQLTAETTNEIESLKTKISTLNEQIDFSKKNAERDEIINMMREDVNKIDLSIDETKDRINKNKNQIENLVNQIESINKTINDIRAYKLAESTVKLYKTLLGKKGLPQFIFASMLNLINGKLNESLEKLDFRLVFNPQTLELNFIDMVHQVSRPVQFISGMQETISGLALVELKRKLNNSLRFNYLFIDEVSAKVTDGKTLSYDSKNYRSILSDFIYSMSDSVNIIIVDHVLDFNGRVLEVVPSINGSYIQEIETTIK